MSTFADIYRAQARGANTVCLPLGAASPRCRRPQAHAPYQETSEEVSGTAGDGCVSLSPRSDFSTSSNLPPPSHLRIRTASGSRDNFTNPLRLNIFYAAQLRFIHPHTRTSDLPRAIRDFQGLVKAGLRSPTLEADAADTPDIITGVRQAGVRLPQPRVAKAKGSE